jgi:hypothetical protein
MNIRVQSVKLTIAASPTGPAIRFPLPASSEAHERRFARIISALLVLVSFPFLDYSLVCYGDVSGEQKAMMNRREISIRDRSVSVSQQERKSTVSTVHTKQANVRAMLTWLSCFNKWVLIVYDLPHYTVLYTKHVAYQGQAQCSDRRSSYTRLMGSAFCGEWRSTVFRSCLARQARTPSTNNHQPTTINQQPSTNNHQPTVINQLSSIINSKLLDICRMPAPSHLPSSGPQDEYFGKAKLREACRLQPSLRSICGYLSGYLPQIRVHLPHSPYPPARPAAARCHG